LKLNFEKFRNFFSQIIATLITFFLNIFENKKTFLRVLESF
jgi:hypothetical protein